MNDPISAGPGSAGTLARALSVYRRTTASRSALVLLVANAIPLVGVLFFGWSLWTILVLYWLENGIVGFWNVPKILLAQRSVIPTLPELPPSAAWAATGNAAEATSLREAWQRARDARARQMASDAAGPGGIGRRNEVGRATMAAFFCVHYGMFWFVHGVFIFTLPLFLGAGGGATGGGACGPASLGSVPFDGGPVGIGPFGLGGDVLQQCGGAFGAINWTSILIGGSALFLSHGASFVFNYVGRGEYRTASPGSQMAAPYARVVILHLTIILGAFVVAFLGAPIGALIVLVGLKAAFDLGLHLRERGHADSAWRAAASAAGSGAAAA